MQALTQDNISKEIVQALANELPKSPSKTPLTATMATMGDKENWLMQERDDMKAKHAVQCKNLQSQIKDLADQVEALHDKIKVLSNAQNTLQHKYMNLMQVYDKTAAAYFDLLEA